MFAFMPPMHKFIFCLKRICFLPTFVRYRSVITTQYFTLPNLYKQQTDMQKNYYSCRSSCCRWQLEP